MREKANILWEAFKDRLGQSEFKEMLFNLSFFLNSHDGLLDLESPFSKQEIDDIIRELSNNKSSRPDGFNNEFIKGCWSLIEYDFQRLFQGFFDGDICLKTINSSHIALILKKMAR